MDIDAADPTFYWDATRDVLAACPRFTVDEQRKAFVGTSPAGRRTSIRPPLIQPIATDVTTVDDFLAALSEVPGVQLVILMQAGAAAIGWFDGTASIATKTIKKYVVRGSGRAQPTYLESKGKSRYGSRLRLQNAKALLVEVNERLHGWYQEFGPPDDIFYSCPVRTWPELLAAKPPPPFEADGSPIRIPLDVSVPTTEVLLRTFKKMCYGRVERLSGPTP